MLTTKCRKLVMDFVCFTVINYCGRVCIRRLGQFGATHTLNIIAGRLDVIPAVCRIVPPSASAMTHHCTHLVLIKYIEVVNVGLPCPATLFAHSKPYLNLHIVCKNKHDKTAQSVSTMQNHFFVHVSKIGIFVYLLVYICRSVQHQ